MKNLTWPQVAVILGFLACVTTLGLTHNDTAALIAVGVALLGGLGLNLGQTNAIKENTNGNHARVLEMLATNQAELVAVVRSLPASPPTIELPAPMTWIPDQDKHAA